MRRVLIVLVLLPLAVGCQRFVVRTKVQMDGPVETRLDMTPISPTAGHVRPVVVQPGAGGGRVAVVDVDGLILNTPFVGPMSVGENPVGLFREKLEAIERDRSVRAVVLRVNSHGGGVAACIAMRRDLERFKARTGLPVVACLMDTAAGGAYYLASASDQIVAGPATVTGGVGVILNLFNLRDLMAQFNVIPQSIKAGELADIGTSARALTDAEKALLQKMADEFHLYLQADVRRSRPGVSLEAGTTFDGRIFTGSQAKARGLVDHLGDLDDAILMAAQLGCPAACPPGGAVAPVLKPEVIMFRRNNDPARSVYAVTGNIPLQGAGLLPNLPGLDRAKMPTFLSVWQPELTMEKLGGK
jgi:protease-4